MGERDAFGREIGEDSLAELGWQHDEDSRPDAGARAGRECGAAVHGAPQRSSSRRRRCPATGANGGAASDSS